VTDGVRHDLAHSHDRGNAVTGDGELRGQARRGAERREAIIEAAMSVFAERGFRGGALAAVAELVDVSPAGILYHFGSKEELLLAVIAERDRRAADTPVVTDDRRGLDALASTVRFARQSEAERGLAALHTVLQVESLEADAPTHGYFLGRSRFVRAAVAELLREAKSLGEVRAEVDCEAKAVEIIAFLEGAAVVWLLDPEVSLVDLYTNYFEDLRRSLAPGTGAASS
jgi:AcrR family transcriptional regulator